MDAGARGRRLLQRREYRAKVSEFIPKELEDQYASKGEVISELDLKKIGQKLKTGLKNFINKPIMKDYPSKKEYQDSIKNKTSNQYMSYEPEGEMIEANSAQMRAMHDARLKKKEDDKVASKKKDVKEESELERIQRAIKTKTMNGKPLTDEQIQGLKAGLTQGGNKVQEGTKYGLYKGSGKASGAFKDYLDKKKKEKKKKEVIDEKKKLYNSSPLATRVAKWSKGLKEGDVYVKSNRNRLTGLPNLGKGDKKSTERKITGVNYATMAQSYEPQGELIQEMPTDIKNVVKGGLSSAKDQFLDTGKVNVKSTLKNTLKNALRTKTVTDFLKQESACGKGEYYCNDDQKCKPIPDGYKEGKDGMLVKEAKYEKGASTYGKASIRNKRMFGKGGNAADPKERGAAITVRRARHQERRYVKKGNKYHEPGKHRPEVHGVNKPEEERKGKNVKENAVVDKIMKDLNFIQKAKDTVGNYNKKLKQNNDAINKVMPNSATLNNEGKK